MNHSDIDRSSSMSTALGTGSQSRKVADAVLTVVLAMGAIAAVAVMLASYRTPQRDRNRPQDPPPPSQAQQLAGSPRMGSPGAPVALIIYSDFECPFCAKFALETLPQLRRLYVDSGKVLVAFRNLPLAMHTQAEPAAVAAACASQQGAFWKAHDLLFTGQHDLTLAAFNAIAERLALDRARFNTCLASQNPAIHADALHAEQIGLHVTPSFLIGRTEGDGVHVTRVMSGAQNLEAFKRALDAELR